MCTRFVVCRRCAGAVIDVDSRTPGRSGEKGEKAWRIRDVGEVEQRLEGNLGGGQRAWGGVGAGRVSERAGGGQGTAELDGDEVFNHVQHRRDRKQMWRPEVAGGSVAAHQTEGRWVDSLPSARPTRPARGGAQALFNSCFPAVAAASQSRTLRPSVRPWRRRPPPPIQMKINV